MSVMLCMPLMFILPCACILRVSVVPMCVVVVVPVWAVRGGVLYAGRRIIDLIFRREGVRMEGVSRNDEVVSTDFCLEQE